MQMLTLCKKALGHHLKCSFTSLTGSLTFGWMLKLTIYKDVSFACPGALHVNMDVLYFCSPLCDCTAKFLFFHAKREIMQKSRVSKTHLHLALTYLPSYNGFGLYNSQRAFPSTW